MVSVGLTCVTVRSMPFLQPADSNCALRLAWSSVVPADPSNSVAERLSSWTGSMADCASACVVDRDWVRTPPPGPGSVPEAPPPPEPQPARRRTAVIAPANLVRMIWRYPLNSECRVDTRPLHGH